MAMTREQAIAAAFSLRSKRPDLQNIPVVQMVDKIMDAGAADLSTIFPVPVDASRPAPVQPDATIVAPKPTAPPPPARQTLLPDAVRQMAEFEANPRVPLPQVLGIPSPPPPPPPSKAPESRGYQSRFRPILEASLGELKNLQAVQQQALAENKEVPLDVAQKIDTLGARVNRLQAMVAAEEGAVVDTDRAALIGRQEERLTREQELIDKARKRAPGRALMEFGKALAGAQKGESFASALARGLAAGAESYAGSRKASEEGLRGIEERRDAITQQRIDALQKARDDALRMSDAGYALDKDTLALAKLTDDQIVSDATRSSVISAAKSAATKAEVEATFAPLMAQAEIDLRRAQALDARRGPVGRGGSPAGPKPSATVYNALASQVKNLQKLIADPYTQDPDRATYRVQLKQAQRLLAEYGAKLGVNPAPGAPASNAAPLRWDPQKGVQPNK